MQITTPQHGEAPHPQIDAAALLDTVRTVAAELHPARSATRPVLDGRLEEDYGFDSLGRVELVLRIERQFGVTLPERIIATAETPRDLMRALLAANPRAASPVVAERAAALALESDTPDEATTLAEVLAWHAGRHPARPHLVLIDEEAGERTVTYAALDEAARTYAAALLERGLEPGAKVAIMLPTGTEYFFSFLGILLAGGVPVPIYPPARASQIEDHLQRHAGILTNAQAEMLITVAQAKPLALLLRPRVATLKHVVTPAELERAASLAVPHRAQAQDVAMLQYTSGSTGNPKGVIVTHANLLTNIRAMARALRVTPADVFVSWLPLYHDMGLIGAWMGSLVCGMKYPVMSPLTFLARPERWLWAMHRHGGTLSGGPNFCYELCVHRIEDAAIRGLDLGSWRFAFNGAEPVSAETIEAFTRRFAAYGFKPEAMAPVYGLAEATLGVSFPPPARGPKVDRVKREVFTRDARAEPAVEGDADVLSFVACGYPIPGHQVRVVDARGHELSEREEGRLQFSGPSVTSGYYRNPEATALVLRDGWMDTGDYGYVAEGEVYISGRAKDIIIRAGRNILPYELEEAVGSLEGIRKGCVAVFGVQDGDSGTERIVVLAETRETDTARREQISTRINELAVSLIGMPVDEIVLAPPQTVLKTSSGKIRRAASREAYLRGGTVARRAVWLQVVRLAALAVVPQLRRSLRAFTDRLYGAYALFMLGSVGTLTWLVCAALPRPDWCWWFSRRTARFFLAATGMRLRLHGLENLPERGHLIAVNHASYLDGPVLLAALETPRKFIAKRELLDHAVPGVYLRRIDSEFVERFDVQRSVEDTGRFVALARAGKSLIVFPEGTFRRMPGLLPFRMGAFSIAAQAGMPVVPVAIRGTRSALREGQWLFRRNVLSVTVGTPVEPAGSDWNAAVGLRDAVRAQMLRLCAEPDLGEETLLPPKKPLKE